MKHKTFKLYAGDRLLTSDVPAYKIYLELLRLKYIDYPPNATTRLTSTLIRASVQRYQKNDASAYSTIKFFAAMSGYTLEEV